MFWGKTFKSFAVSYHVRFLYIPFHSFTFLYIVESCRVILHHSPGSQNKPTHVDCCFGEVLRWEIATFSIVTLRNLGIMLMAL